MGDGRRRVSAVSTLEQLREFIDAQTGLADDGAECSPVQFFVVGNYQLREGFLATEDNVAAFLAREEKASLLQRLDAFSPRYPRQLAHTAITRTSKRSAGTGRPSSSNNITPNGFLDILDSFFASLPLAYATRQAGTIGYPIAVFAWIDNHLAHIITF